MNFMDQFRTEIEAYLKASGMTKTEFGKEVMGNSAFLFRLESPRGPAIKTVDKVRTWMAKHPPKPKGNGK